MRLLTLPRFLKSLRCSKTLVAVGLIPVIVLGASGCLLTQLPTQPPASPTPTQPSPTLPPSPSATVTLAPTQTPTPETSGNPEILETPRVLETLGFLETPGVLTTSEVSAPSYEIIGISVLGRPLEVYGFGSGDEQLMIVAGIHGGYEWNTIALADELIAYLQENPEVIPPTKTLFILRNLNPDGEAADHGPDGRGNAHGVDLNRNFPANWELNFRRSGCWQERPLTAGISPASEPETQALMAFVKAHPKLQALISYHSAGLGVFPGGIPPDPKSIRLAEILATVSGYKYPPEDTGCLYTGQLIDWVAAQGIAAVDIELTNHRDTDFEINLKILEAFLTFEP